MYRPAQPQTPAPPVAEANPTYVMVRFEDALEARLFIRAAQEGAAVQTNFHDGSGAYTHGPVTILYHADRASRRAKLEELDVRAVMKVWTTCPEYVPGQITNSTKDDLIRMILESEFGPRPE